MAESHSRFKERCADYAVAPETLGRMRAEFEQHLGECEECRREVSALRATARLIEETPLESPPVDTWSAISGRIRPRTAPAGTGPLPWRRLAFAAAAIVLLAVLAVGTLVHLGPGTLAEEPESPAAYIEMHAIASWGDPLADQASLALAAVAAEEDPQ